MKGVFDNIVLIQDNFLTGSWNPLTLFIFMIMSSVVINYVYKTVNSMKINKNEIFIQALQIATIAIFINYVTGNLFTSRTKMYKTKGFSTQKATIQAYSDARLSQVLGVLMK